MPTRRHRQHAHHRWNEARRFDVGGGTHCPGSARQHGDDGVEAGDGDFRLLGDAHGSTVTRCGSCGPGSPRDGRGTRHRFRGS
jgi:hypothetical protein